jgi:hypothetical protein
MCILFKHAWVWQSILGKGKEMGKEFVFSVTVWKLPPESGEIIFTFPTLSFQ